MGKDLVTGKTKNELLLAMTGMVNRESLVQDQQKMGIIVRCTEDIESKLERLTQTMEQNSNAQDSLANKLFWLNVVLTAATAIATVAGVLGMVHKW